MKLNELLDGVEVLFRGAPDNPEIAGLTCDSKAVCPGWVFFAVPGTRADGSRYIPQAVKNGVALVVTAGEPPDGVPCVVVADVRRACALMAGNFYGHADRELTMIGVTGTNGKTSVTHILKGILDANQKCRAGLIGTNHNLVGRRELDAERTTPDAITLHRLLREMRDEGCTHCVMEVSSHAMMQSRVAGIQFDRAVFMNLTQDHLDYHGDMDSYFAAKASLFDQCDLAIVNQDDPYGRSLLRKEGINAVTFSARQDSADVVAKNIQLRPTKVEFEAVTRSEIARIEWNTPGAFSVHNALAAIVCALMEGMRMLDIAAAIRGIPPIEGRMEALAGPRGSTVIIDYAHTPDALEKLLSSVKAWHNGRIFTLFGCGGNRDKGKRAKMGKIAAAGSNFVFVTSDNPRDEEPEAILRDILAGMPENASFVTAEPDRRVAISKALKKLREGDLLLLCGKGHEKTQEIKGEFFPLCERQIVEEWMNNDKS